MNALAIDPAMLILFFHAIAYMAGVLTIVAGQQRALAHQLTREQVSLDAAPDGILWVAPGGTIVSANPAAAAMSGYAIDELEGANIALLIQPHLRERHVAALDKYFGQPSARPMGMLNLELLRKDGSTLAVDIALGHWDDGVGKVHAIAYMRDLSERRKFEESLRHKATHDELTGLPNRWLFNLQLDQAIAGAQRAGTHVALIMLDLDNFKNVNDSYGHAAGDALLCQAGERIRAVLRGNDVLARLGGDEFVVLLGDLAQEGDAIGVAAKLLQVLHGEYQLGEHAVLSGASLGLAFYPDDAIDAATLMRYADMAMYQAKRAGRGGYACYASDSPG